MAMAMGKVWEWPWSWSFMVEFRILTEPDCYYCIHSTFERAWTLRWPWASCLVSVSANDKDCGLCLCVGCVVCVICHRATQVSQLATSAQAR